MESVRGGQATFFKKFDKSQIRKFWGSLRYRKSANLLDVLVRKLQIRKFLWYIHKPQIKKFLEYIAQLCFKAELKVVFLHDFKLCTNLNLSPQITKKIGSANRKSAKCHSCGRSAITNFFSPQICGFAICGTYLRTVQPEMSNSAPNIELYYSPDSFSEKNAGIKWGI